MFKKIHGFLSLLAIILSAFGFLMINKSEDVLDNLSSWKSVFLDLLNSLSVFGLLIVSIILILPYVLFGFISKIILNKEKQLMLVKQAIDQIALNYITSYDKQPNEAERYLALGLLTEELRASSIKIKGRRKIEPSDEYGEIMSDHWEEIPASYWQTHRINYEAISGSGIYIQTELRNKNDNGAKSEPLYKNLRLYKNEIHQMWPKKISRKLRQIFVKN